MKQALKKMAIITVRPFIVPLTKKNVAAYYNGDHDDATLDAKRVLVFAPHVDDETIGLGGTIRKHSDLDADVHVVFVTDGANSVANMPKETLIAKRKEEAKKAQRHLRFASMEFLDIPDGSVREHEALREMLTQLINERQPELIYTTTYVDCHPDHVWTTTWLAQALKETNDPPSAIRLYEINCPVPPQFLNTVVDITETFDAKRQAMDVFSSQAIDFDGFTTLAEAKAQLLNNNNARAAEAFIEVTPKQLIHQVERAASLNITYSDWFKQANKTETLLWAIFKNERHKVHIYEQATAN